ncbi:MAG: MFS transporter [Clostridia bacterium]|nr:MFS transporter [Clostridia bacterium]
MKTKEEKIKNNLRLFPITKTLGWDYLFFYATNFLFLTQVKNIAASSVILIDSFYALFGILMQIPATFIIEFLGRKKSIVLANVLNAAYMLVVLTSVNLFNLIVAEIFSSLAFAIKESAEPSLLNESIPASKNKSKIFSRINEKGMANWYILNAITTVLAGFFYTINPYIPISCALILNVIVAIISLKYTEPVDKKNSKTKRQVNQMKEIKEAFEFIFKSERVKSLILCSALVIGLVDVLHNYQVSLLEELNVDPRIICTLLAIIGVVSGLATKKQEEIHEAYRNKSLSVLLITIAASLIIAGIFGIIAKTYIYVVLIIFIAFLGWNCSKAIFFALMERYLSNFANEEVDTKIFVARNFLASIMSALVGLIASFLLERMNTAYSMLILGIISLIVSILLIKYMKNRVGLKPSQYSKEEIKYDELK